jgi:putative acetyltransferase
LAFAFGELHTMIKGYSGDTLTAETGVASSDIKHLASSAHPKNMLTILIRPYKASDVSSLVSLFRASVRGIAARDYDPSQIRAWAPDTIDKEKFGHRRESKATWVAEVEDRIGGFSDLASDGHVDSLYVHPDFQRRGVARALLQYVEQEARAIYVRRLYTEASITARPAFEAVGFRVIVPQTITMRGEAMTVYRMEKQLDAGPTP